MKPRRRAEPELVDSGRPAYYVVPQPWWRRAIRWAGTHPREFPLVYIVTLVLLLGPVYLLGRWWFAVVAALTVGFWAGFWVARREWLDTGKIDPP